MLVAALRCSQCGGALPKAARWMLVTCPHCGGTVSANQHIVRRSDYAQSLAALRDEVTAMAAHSSEPVIRVADRTIRLLATLAHTDRATIYLGGSLGRFAERFTVKIAHDGADESTFASSVDKLREVQRSSVSTAAFYLTRIPEVTASGVDRTLNDGQPRRVLLTRHPAEYWGSLDGVLAHHPEGIDARHVAWMGARAFDLMAFVHESGFIHGAPSLDHWLVHPRDHSLFLIGWSSASRPLPSAIDGLQARDLRILAWSLRTLLSHRSHEQDVTPPVMRADIPSPFADFFLRSTEDATWLATQSARSLFLLLREATAKAFGPRRYVHFDPCAAAPGSAG